MYEEPLLIKLGLGTKYPRKALYNRKGALGIGLMKLTTIVAMMKLKLFIGNKRKEGNAHIAIKYQEEFCQVEVGQWVSIGEDPKKYY